MRGFTITFISFMLMSSYTCEDIVTLFNESKKHLPEQFHPILNFDIPHKQLVNVYKRNMIELAPFCTISSHTFSKVLFDFVSFDPFSRRPGKEINESYFVSNVYEKLTKMKESNSEKELNALEETIEHMINGLTKASLDFELISLRDFFNKFIDSYKKIDPNDTLHVNVFKKLGKFVNHFMHVQIKLFGTLNNIQNNMVSIAESLLKTLILSSYQPNFKESYLETYKLRALEVIYFINMVYYYNEFNSNLITFRSKIINREVKNLTKGVHNLVFDDIEKGSFGLLNKRIELLKKEEESILNYFIDNTKTTIKNELETLRLNVEKKEMQHQQPQLKKQEIQNQQPQLEKQEMQKQKIEIEKEEIQNQGIPVEKEQLHNKQPQLEKKEKKN